MEITVYKYYINKVDTAIIISDKKNLKMKSIIKIGIQFNSSGRCNPMHLTI